MVDFDHVKDSGKREEFATGSVRDSQDGKGRFDLIPYHSLFRLARHFENGAVKYGPDNWRLGQKLSRYLSSASRHLAQWGASKRGELQLDEDHLAAAAWNIFALMWTENEIKEGRLSAELDDIHPTTPAEPVTLKVYVASKFEEKDRVREVMKSIKVMGCMITHDWTSQDATRPRSEWADGDVVGVTNANLFLGLFEKELDYKGALTELGIAIGQGKKIWIVGHGADRDIFVNTTGVVRFDNLEDMLEALLEMTVEEILA